MVTGASSEALFTNGVNMTFLEAINRILRVTTVMQWDDDNITSFTQNQHAATISLARQAVQHVVNDLTTDRFLFPEDAQDHLTMVTGTRTYSLASDFVRLQGKEPWFHRLEGAIGTQADGRFLAKYPGGEDALKKEVPQYTHQQGTPQWYYFTDDQEIGIYPIPESADNGAVYRYDYQKDTMPESESDSLPVYNDAQGYAFVDAAARVFTFLWTTQPVDGLKDDSIYKGAKGMVMALARKRASNNRYGYSYR